MKRRLTRKNKALATPVGRRRPSNTEPVAVFRNSRDGVHEPPAVTAREAKREFGRVLNMAVEHGAIVITKHDTPKAVLLSFENFTALARATGTRRETFSRQFDRLLQKMQAPTARLGMKRAFAASGKELGRAAVATARARD